MQINKSLKKERGRRCVQGFVFLLRVWLSYISMLAVMTYNVGVICAVVLGLASGYLILGFAPAEILVINDTMKKASPPY